MNQHIGFVLLFIAQFNRFESIRLRPRIIGGHYSAKAQHPYIVSIGLFDTMEHQCGGTIVSNRHIVSAGHCVVGYQPENLFVLVGALNRLLEGDAIIIERIAIHPLYEDANLLHDISVLKTLLLIDSSNNVRPIALPKIHLPASGGIECVVSGWGLTVIIFIFFFGIL